MRPPSLRWHFIAGTDVRAWFAVLYFALGATPLAWQWVGAVLMGLVVNQLGSRR